MHKSQIGKTSEEAKATLTKLSGALYDVGGELININEVAKRAICSVTTARKYIVHGTMPADKFIQLKNPTTITTDSINVKKHKIKLKRLIMGDELDVEVIKKELNNFVWMWLPPDTTLAEAEGVAIEMLNVMTDFDAKKKRHTSA